MTTTTQQPAVTDVHRTYLRDFLYARKGRFVSLDFIKVDGSQRKLTGRLGVKKFTRGGVNPAIRQDRPYLVVYDTQKKGYRNVNLDTVSCVRCNHVEHSVIG